MRILLSVMLLAAVLISGCHSNPAPTVGSATAADKRNPEFENKKKEALERIEADQQLFPQVRNDIGVFAGTENRFFRENARYATLDELKQYDSSLPETTRGPFTYSIDVVNDAEPKDFHVIATDSRDPKHPKIMGPDLRLRQGPIAEIYIKQ
jgi:hypothetical protein